MSVTDLVPKRRVIADWICIDSSWPSM